MSRSHTYFADLMDTLRENWLLSIILLLLLLAVAWFGLQYLNESKRETRLQYTPNDQSQLNPFYATQLLLNEHNGFEIASTQPEMDLVTLIDELPYLTMTDEGKHPTLIVRSIGDSLTDNQQQALIDWIENGGHLVVFASGNSIAYDDWQPIAERIEKLQLQHGGNAQNSDWTTDEKLTDLLSELDTVGQNVFLRKLGVYQVRVRSSSMFDEALDDSYANDKSSAIENSANYAQQFDKELIPFKLSDDEKAVEDAKISIDNYDVKNNLEHFNYQNLYFTTAIQSDALLKLENTKTKLIPDLMYAQNRQTKPSDSFKPLTITEIRSMLANQLAQADKLVEQSDDLGKKLDNHWYALNALEMQKTLQIMQKLSDKRLLYMFNADYRVFVDSDFGKGRLSIVSDASILGNPDQEGLDYAQKIQETTPDMPTIFHRDLGNLYAYDNASLLLALTEDSSEIWLFPNVDIDNLPVILWKKARLALLGLMLLCFVWLWSLYNKFGKRQVLATGTDSDIFLYFRQIGRYGWEHDRAKRLGKVTRMQADKLAKKTLHLTENEPLLSSHMPKLSQLLRSRLADRLNENTVKNAKNQEILAMMKAHKTQLLNLLTAEQLQESLLPTGNDLDSLTAHGFTEYTQTLWLVKWLLS